MRLRRPVWLVSRESATVGSGRQQPSALLSPFLPLYSVFLSFNINSRPLGSRLLPFAFISSLRVCSFSECSLFWWGTPPMKRRSRSSPPSNKRVLTQPGTPGPFTADLVRDQLHKDFPRAYPASVRKSAALRKQLFNSIHIMFNDK